MPTPFNQHRQFQSGSAGTIKCPLKEAGQKARIYHFFGFKINPTTAGDISGPHFTLKVDGVEREYGPEFLSQGQSFQIYLAKEDEFWIRFNHNEFALTVFASGVYID